MINKFRQIVSNKNYRPLIENILSLGVLQLVNLLMPLVVLPYLLKTIGFNHYGIIVVAASLVMYFQSLTDYSFAITGTRDVAIFRESKKKLDLIFSKIMTVKLLFLVISLLVISGIVFLIPKFSDYKEIVFLSTGILIGNVLFPDWFFQGIEKMKFITIINTSVKILFTILVFIFIKGKNDFWIYPLLQSLGYVFSGLIALMVILFHYKVKFHFLKRKKIIQTIKDNFPIFINQFMPVLYNNTSSFLLGIMVSNSAAGIFDSLKKIIDMAIMFIGVISRAFFPFMNRQKNFFPKYKKMLLSIASLLAIIILLFSKYIFSYFSIDYKNSIFILGILCVGILGIAIYNIFGTNYLIVNRKDKLVMKNTFYASILGFAISFPLIYYLGIIGGAISLSFSRLFLGLGVVYLYNEISKNEK
ncbi:oligosaccharide flippase family protein [Riemerella columbina]|uniref:oligosaccharide flippase family protein n=1 Tax=Riemerella columbina TaxID=103810 RepID=UPI00039C84F9|nr:oligosaccharide flippase family protein [Riemerella columbina]